MAFILPLMFIVLIILVIRYHWQRRHIYIFANKLEGPPALPIIGNALSFMGHHEDILKTLTKMTERYNMPLRFWFGPLLLVFFSNPDHIEKILSSQKFAHKHVLYSILKVYLGDGLVSNSGEKYKKHRKLIQPLINIKFVSSNIEVFQRHINIYLKNLEQRAGKATFDIHDLTHECFADAIGEMVLGIQMGTQLGKNKEYVKASLDMYEVCYNRLMKPWLYLDLIYNFTKGKILENDIINVTTTFIKKALEGSIARTRSRIEKGNTDDPTIPIIDQIAEMIEKDPTLINDTDFLYHMYTLYCASEDTMTVIAAILCVCMGMYPEYQKIAAEEIRNVIGENPGEISYDDLSKLNYLDMCVRDVLRLIPIAPVIVRNLYEDFLLDKMIVPKGCGILISIFDVHRDPEHWQNPHHFHPDHFLPEEVKKRHNFAYVPFSAGSRSCIGKVLAFAGLKLIMANILQRFEIEADGKFPDIILRCDITVRSISGYNVRLKERIWT